MTMYPSHINNCVHIILTAMFVIKVTALHCNEISQQINNTLFTDTKITFIYTSDIN